MAILTTETNVVTLGGQLHTTGRRGQALHEEEVVFLIQVTCNAVRRPRGIGVGDRSTSGARSPNR